MDAKKMEKRKSRVIIVGINPSGGNPKKVSKTMQKLYKWVEEVGIQYFSFMNTFNEIGVYKSSKIDYNGLLCCKDYDKVVALGGFVSKALDKINVDHFMMPHPSPLNRKLNSKVFERKCLKKLWKYLN